MALNNGMAMNNGLAKIETQKLKEEICHDDSAVPVKAHTLDELHSLQVKKSNPNTPIIDLQQTIFGFEADKNKQQLESISASLASLTRETGPKVVRGDPAKQAETPKVVHASHQHQHQQIPPFSNITDSALKFTHILYNLSPAGN